MKLITIEGNVFRADRIEAISRTPGGYSVGVYLCDREGPWRFSYDTVENACAAHLRAVMDWKKALE